MNLKESLTVHKQSIGEPFLALVRKELKTIDRENPNDSELGAKLRKIIKDLDN
jgi:hypothetical protein